MTRTTESESVLGQGVKQRHAVRPRKPFRTDPMSGVSRLDPFFPCPLVLAALLLGASIIFDAAGTRGADSE
jgi:hypothetical protein